jgi:hypothetical protein
VFCLVGSFSVSGSGVRQSRSDKLTKSATAG